MLLKVDWIAGNLEVYVRFIITPAQGTIQESSYIVSRLSSQCVKHLLSSPSMSQIAACWALPSMSSEPSCGRHFAGDELLQ